jgi:hypothetical protein
MKKRTTMRHPLTTLLSILTTTSLLSGCTPDQAAIEKSVDTAFVKNINKINQETSARSHGGIHLPIDIVIESENDDEIVITATPSPTTPNPTEPTPTEPKPNREPKFNAVLAYKNKFNFKITAEIKDKDGNAIDITDKSLKKELKEITQNVTITNKKGKISSKHEDKISEKTPVISKNYIEFSGLTQGSSYILILSYEENVSQGITRYYEGAIVFQVE